MNQQQGLNAQAMQGQQGINSQNLGQQQDLASQYISGLQNTDQNQMQQLMTQLGPTGQLGQQMMGEFSNYGLTPNSGGFQQGLANTIGNLSMQQQQQIATALGQGYGNISGAGQTGSNALSGLQSQGLGSLSSLESQGSGALSGLTSQGAGALSSLGSQGAGALSGLQSQGAGAMTNAGTLGMENIANTQNTGTGALSGLNSQGLSNQQGVANQGQSALSSLLGSGMQDTTGAQSSGLNSSLGLVNQDYTTQSNLGIGGLSAYQSALQQPLQQGINQTNTQQGQQNSLQNLLTTQGFDQNNFNQQSTLGQLLANQGSQSTLQSILGMASGTAQGGGSLMQGGAAASKATSYVCKELIKRDLLCESDMDDFHVHIMPAMFKKGRAFWKYAADGKALVDAVNAKGLDWKVFKPLLFDRVMDEPDACKAVDLYADACHQLCISADPELWDERVFRDSIWDSLIFLPRLLTYAPFIEALAKCIRIKTLIIYDKPRCEVHR